MRASPGGRRIRAPSPSAGARRGVTLLELLVAMTIFTMLGLSLMLILRGGLTTWRRAEARRESYDAAQAVLGQLREDLLAAEPPHDTPQAGLGPVDVRFLCDRDPRTGLQRLFLVRSIKAESEHPITGLAGTSLAGDAVLDYRGDLSEARNVRVFLRGGSILTGGVVAEGEDSLVLRTRDGAEVEVAFDSIARFVPASRLRATGGSQEVAWVLGDDRVLYRGIKSPIGPPNSLFASQDPYELAPRAGADGEAREDLSDPDLPALLRPFASDVLYVEYRFWTQYSTTWDLDEPCRRFPYADEESGPLDYWDSTRALLAPPSGGGDRRLFDTFVDTGSLSDSRDDVVPAKVFVTLVLEEAVQAGSTTFLEGPVSASDDQLYVQDPGRLNPQGGFVLIEDEWIEFSAVVGSRVQVAPDGRGARGTTPADHGGGLEVTAGRTFSAIMNVPCYREDWADGLGGAAR